MKLIFRPGVSLDVSGQPDCEPLNTPWKWMLGVVPWNTFLTLCSCLPKYWPSSEWSKSLLRSLLLSAQMNINSVYFSGISLNIVFTISGGIALGPELFFLYFFVFSMYIIYSNRYLLFNFFLDFLLSILCLVTWGIIYWLFAWLCLLLFKVIML